MMKSFFTVAISVAILSLCSCSKDNVSNIDSFKYITVSTEIGGMSRVATDSAGGQSFENGDVISVYAWTGTKNEGEIVAPAKGERVVNNSHNTLSGNSWEAEPRMLWRNMQEKHYFIGVYPAIEQGKGLDDDLTQYAYTLDPTNEKTSDLLVAVQTDGILAGYGSVPLAFTHIMAKVNVNLTYRNQWGLDGDGNNIVPTVTSVQLVGAASKATINLLKREVKPDNGNLCDQELPVVVANKEYSSIVIPQTDVHSVIVVIEGKKYTYNHATSIKFESGKVTTINLMVGRDEIKFRGSEVSITPWNVATDSIEGDAKNNE